MKKHVKVIFILVHFQNFQFLCFMSFRIYVNENFENLKRSTWYLEKIMSFEILLQIIQNFKQFDFGLCRNIYMI